MHIERIHKMIECLTEKALGELDKGVENVNTEEMGEAVDMIKDLCEAEYKAVIVKSMKKADEEEEEYNKELLRTLKAEYGEEGGRRYYDEYRYKTTGRYAPKGKGTYVGRRGYEEPPYMHMYPERDMDREYGRMYYTEPTATHTSESGYDRAKRNYTEVKEMHSGTTPEDKEQRMKALDKYIKTVTNEIIKIVSDNATTEEKSLIKNNMNNLMSKF
jgi:hypothetical protein